MSREGLASCFCILHTKLTRRDTRVDVFELMDAGIKRREGRANEDQIEDLSI